MSHGKRFPYEKVARLDSPERKAMQPAAPLVELLASFEPTTILDVGVGTGYFALPIAEALPGARVLGLDVEPQMLEVLTERAAAAPHGHRVEPLEAPEDRIPLPDASVDMVLMVNLYHELADRVAYLEETRRVLEPGGHLVICDWDPDSTREAGPPADHRVSPSIACDELDAAGLVQVQRHHLYEPFYTLVAASR